MGFFSTIASAVAGPLISGLFGMGKKKQQTTSNTVNYVALRREAERAGFNPLTALRNGGSAGFTQTHNPVLSGSEYAKAAIGQGLAAGVQAAFDYNPLDEQKSRLEMEIMQGQLRRINEGGTIDTRMGGAPVATGGRYRYGGGELGSKAQPTEGPVSVTNPLPGGAVVNPGLVDAEAWETRYGDLLQEVGGLINVAGDLYTNMDRAFGGTFRGYNDSVSNPVRLHSFDPIGEIKSLFGKSKYRTGKTW